MQFISYKVVFNTDYRNVPLRTFSRYNYIYSMFRKLRKSGKQGSGVGEIIRKGKKRNFECLIELVFRDNHLGYIVWTGWQTFLRVRILSIELFGIGWTMRNGVTLFRNLRNIPYVRAMILLYYTYIYLYICNLCKKFSLSDKMHVSKTHFGNVTAFVKMLQYKRHGKICSRGSNNTETRPHLRWERRSNVEIS